MQTHILQNKKNENISSVVAQSFPPKSESGLII
jgi:hypothetical protein